MLDMTGLAGVGACPRTGACEPDESEGISLARIAWDEFRCPCGGCLAGTCGVRKQRGRWQRQRRRRAATARPRSCERAGSQQRRPRSSTPAAAGVKVGMAYDVGGRGDKSFNDLAAAGLDKAKTDLGVETKELAAVQGESEQAEGAAGCTLLAQSGYNPIVAVGFAYATARRQGRAEVPEDPLRDHRRRHNCTGKTAQPNVECLLFSENESSFLVGVAAALATKTKNVGFIGGVNEPLIQKFQAGFAGRRAGGRPGDQDPGQVPHASRRTSAASTTRPRARRPRWACTTPVPTWSTTPPAVRARGLFEAAAAEEQAAIGVDSDQYQTAPADEKQLILTSALKGVDTAVVRLHQGRREGRSSRPAIDAVQPEGQRRRLRDVEPEARPVQGEDRGLQGRRSSPARSRSRRRRNRRRVPAAGPGTTRYSVFPDRFLVPSGGVYEAHGQRRPPTSRPAPPEPAAAPPAVALHGITKRYPGVVANHDIDIAVQRGHVHAIVGENGAGKSTLMKTLYGMHKPDEGEIEIDGEPGALLLAGRRDHAPASAWCTSTSCSPTT